MSIKKFNDLVSYDVRLYETENFAVIPSLGSIVEGWLLIIPKKHYLSYGYLSSEELYKELNDLIVYVGSVVKKAYGDFVIFENGAFCSDKLVGCGVDYAHIHIVPIKDDLIDIIKTRYNKNYNWKLVKSLDVSSTFVKNSQPYLYYRNQSGCSYITTDPNIPSQLFRKAIAYSCGVEREYDWKHYYFDENIDKTINIYKQLFNVI